MIGKYKGLIWDMMNNDIAPMLIHVLAEESKNVYILLFITCFIAFILEGGVHKSGFL